MDWAERKGSKNVRNIICTHQLLKLYYDDVTKYHKQFFRSAFAAAAVVYKKGSVHKAAYAMEINYTFFYLSYLSLSYSLCRNFLEQRTNSSIAK